MDVGGVVTQNFSLNNYLFKLFKIAVNPSKKANFLSEKQKDMSDDSTHNEKFLSCNISFSCSLKPHGPVVEDDHISSLPIKGISAIPSYYPYNSITAHPKEKLNSGYRRRNGEPSPSLAFPGTSILLTQRGYELY